MGGGGGYKTAGGRLMHGGRWRDEHAWPLARTVFTPFYLREGGALATDAPRAQPSATTYRFDPGNPVPSIGGNVSSLLDLLDMPPGVVDPEYAPRTQRFDQIMLAGGFDQVESPRFFGCRPPYLPLGSRADVLVFQTEPLAADTEITGPIEARLWVATNAVDTDFTAKLIDVYPPSRWYPHGYHLNLSDSIVRLRYRNGDGRADFAAPGQAVEVALHAVPDRQPVRARAPHPARHLQLELPALRRQSEHRRGERTRTAARDRRQHRVSRRRAAVAPDPAGDPDRPGPVTGAANGRCLRPGLPHL